MIDLFFKLVGAFGIILISIGILTKKRKIEDIYYIFGGLFLTAYSIFIGDIIFIVLQMVFISSALYDLVKIQFPEKTEIV